VSYKTILSSILLLLFLNSFNTLSFSQDSTKSLAFKKNRPYKNNPYFYQPDLSYQLLQQFKLVQLANSGDPLAQHELGLRLLTGDGIVADTVTAVYWIQKAALQKLTAAMHNYGIMLMNGWGTEWNPFTAYEYFLSAAEAGMSQAQYVVGILYTDNLIVRRDWNKSYFWIKKSADGGYEPAKEVLAELDSKVSHEFKDSVAQNKFSYQKSKNSKDEEITSNIQPSVGLVFIDFDSEVDTVRGFSDEVLLTDLIRINNKLINDSLKTPKDSFFYKNLSTIDLNIISKIAEAGSPEALTILGRLYQTGNSTGLNLLLAAEYYIRATILDSPRSAYLLWKLIREKDFYTILNNGISFNDPTAQFVWYGLHKLGYDNRLTDLDALNLLEKSAKQNHLPAIIETGYNYYSGKYTAQDKNKGIQLWNYAYKLKSIEANVRLALSKVLDQKNTADFSEEIKILQEAESKGSLLAQFALGYCYENGIGLRKSIQEAVKYYRESAQRGNQFAYQQLKRLYDNLRPAVERFKVE
jgi:TPR repeat protein